MNVQNSIDHLAVWQAAVLVVGVAAMTFFVVCSMLLVVAPKWSLACTDKVLKLSPWLNSWMVRQYRVTALKRVK